MGTLRGGKFLFVSQVGDVGRVAWTPVPATPPCFARSSRFRYTCFGHELPHQRIIRRLDDFSVTALAVGQTDSGIE